MKSKHRYSQLSKYILSTVIAVSLTATLWTYRQAIWLDIFNDPALQADELARQKKKNEVSPTEWPIIFAG